MLYVIRHGQTNWNIEGKTQGIIETEINQIGMEQAIKVRNQTYKYKIRCDTCRCMCYDILLF